MTTPPISFLSDPFEGDINPGTADGAKLFASATKDRTKENLLTIAQSKVTDIMATFRHDSNMFCWGKLINMIDDNKGGRVRILEDFTLCNLMLVQEEAARTWFKQDHKNGDPYTHTLKAAFDPATDSDDKIMFFRQVRSKMIAKRIESSLSSASWKVLFGKRKHFTWMGSNGIASYDGPTMLQIIISTVNPSTRVGISDLKVSIRTARLVQVQWDVVALCDKMTADYLLITELNGKHDDMVLDTYTALLSGKNDIFNNFVQRGKDDWELRKDQNYEDVMDNATVKYNNMVKQKIWTQTDPKDVKILALTTLNHELQNGKKAGKSYAGAVTGGGVAEKEWVFTLDPWRIVKEGSSKTVDGKTWNWCPHHKREGKYDGMYVAHTPDKHDEWLERKTS